MFANLGFPRLSVSTSLAAFDAYIYFVDTRFYGD